jgi:hypothetical protein
MKTNKLLAVILSAAVATPFFASVFAAAKSLPSEHKLTIAIIGQSLLQTEEKRLTIANVRASVKKYLAAKDDATRKNGEHLLQFAFTTVLGILHENRADLEPIVQHLLPKNATLLAGLRKETLSEAQGLLTAKAADPKGANELAKEIDTTLSGMYDNMPPKLKQQLVALDKTLEKRSMADCMKYLGICTT